MTIREAIAEVMDIKQCSFDEARLLGWLTEHDGALWHDYLCHYEDAEQPELPYTGIDMETELAVPMPFDVLYPTWLCAKIDYMNGEFERYNNAMTLYNSQLARYTAAYIREHMPKNEAVIVV